MLMKYIKARAGRKAVIFLVYIYIYIDFDTILMCKKAPAGTMVVIWLLTFII